MQWMHTKNNKKMVTLRKMTDDSIKELDKIAGEKEKELLEV